MVEEWLFEKNPQDVLTRAAIRRVAPPEPGSDCITIEREIFDDLVHIASKAAELQAATARCRQRVVIEGADGTFTCTVSHTTDRGSISAHAEANSVIAAFLAGSYAFGKELDKYIS